MKVKRAKEVEEQDKNPERNFNNEGWNENV